MTVGAPSNALRFTLQRLYEREGAQGVSRPPCNAVARRRGGACVLRGKQITHSDLRRSAFRQLSTTPRSVGRKATRPPRGRAEAATRANQWPWLTCVVPGLEATVGANKKVFGCRRNGWSDSAEYAVGEPWQGPEHRPTSRGRGRATTYAYEGVWERKRAPGRKRGDEGWSSSLSFRSGFEGGMFSRRLSRQHRCSTSVGSAERRQLSTAPVGGTLENENVSPTRVCC